MDVDGKVEHKRARDGAGSSEQQQASSSSSDDEELDPALAAALPVPADTTAANGSSAAAAGLHGGSSNSLAQMDPTAGPRSIPRPGFKERCKYIPLRLKLEERRLLRLLEAALNVSEYTDKVSEGTQVGDVVLIARSCARNMFCPHSAAHAQG